MPAPKKAAKKAAKKVAKKAAKHADPKHRESKDLRRAYEHLGRIESLQRMLPETEMADAGALVALAQRQLNEGEAANAADLLRAAEHLSFAALAAGNANQAEVSNGVQQAIAEEFDHLAGKAEEHWSGAASRHAEVASLYKRSLKAAKAAFDRAAYRQALEGMRAAEALSHVEKRGPQRLSAGRELKPLPGSR
jgi:hypothetical protein